MSYATDHASALADVTAAGAAVTFTDKSPGAYASTGTWTGPATTTSVAGAAIEVEGDPKEYEALSLVQRNPATLFFTPTTYGSLPSLDMAVTWGGVSRLVKRVRPLAPDGTAIAAYVVVAV